MLQGNDIYILVTVIMSLYPTMVSLLPANQNTLTVVGPSPVTGQLNVFVWRVLSFLNGVIIIILQLLKVELPVLQPVTWSFQHGRSLLLAPGRIHHLIPFSELKTVLKNGGQKDIVLYAKMPKESGVLFFTDMKTDIIIWVAKPYFNP